MKCCYAVGKKRSDVPISPLWMRKSCRLRCNLHFGVAVSKFNAAVVVAGPAAADPLFRRRVWLAPAERVHVLTVDLWI
jgi:hypothetical protein